MLPNSESYAAATLLRALLAPDCTLVCDLAHEVVQVPLRGKGRRRWEGEDDGGSSRRDYSRNGAGGDEGVEEPARWGSNPHAWPFGGDWGRSIWGGAPAVDRAAATTAASTPRTAAGNEAEDPKSHPARVPSRRRRWPLGFFFFFVFGLQAFLTPVAVRTRIAWAGIGPTSRQ